MRSGLVALLIAGGACADDVPGVTTTSDTETGTSTTDTPMTTTPDPDTTGVATMGMDSGDTTRGESTESDTTQGVTTEPETTTDATTTDATTTDGGGECGNGMAEPGEECDGRDLDGEDCGSQGFDGGALGCAKDCTFDTSNCTIESCGNDVIDGTDECDGMDLGGATCQTEGFDGGVLACAADCTLDTSGCTNITCGNGAIEMGETCDGMALGGETCVTQGFAGGVLGCTVDCLGYDTSGCMNAPCTHDICAEGEALVVGCDPCVDQICGMDAFCCNNSWDAQCVDEVGSICGIMCPAVCGNDVSEPGETCDGTDLGGETCLTQGFVGGGVLACAGDCSAYDTTGCFNVAGGDCCAEHMGIGCDDAACEASVCALDAFCCATQWDAQCANEAIADPNCAGVGGSCPAGGADCCTAHAGTGCDDAVCEASVCALDAFCCDTNWDAQCAGEAAADPNCAGVGSCPAGGADCCAAHAGTGCDDAVCEASVCALDAFCCDTNWDAQCANEAIADPNCAGVGGSCPGGGGFACQDQDIGSAIGAGVAAGSTVGADNDLDPTCALGDALDEVILFTAPAAGQYTFNTDGSTYDTVMSLYSDCATSLACDDDGGMGLQSQLVRNMAAGEVVLILIDGYNGATGNWILNITSP